MDSRRVAEDEFVEVRVVVGNFPSVEVDRERLILLVLSNHETDVAVVDLAVVVVFDLHHFVADPEFVAESLHRLVGWRVQGLLQKEVQGARARAASVHGAENLNVANRINSIGLRKTALHQIHDSLRHLFRLLDLDEVAVAVIVLRRKLRHLPRVDAVRRLDDPG